MQAPKLTSVPGTVRSAAALPARAVRCRQETPTRGQLACLAKEVCMDEWGLSPKKEDEDEWEDNEDADDEDADEGEFDEDWDEEADEDDDEDDDDEEEW